MEEEMDEPAWAGFSIICTKHNGHLKIHPVSWTMTRKRALLIEVI
jgi:hypothetical protein